MRVYVWVRTLHVLHGGQKVAQTETSLHAANFQLLVPVRPGVLRPGLARPDISNRFRRDAVLGRKQAGGARRLGSPYFEDVDGLFLGQPGSLRHCLRLRRGVRGWTSRREARSALQRHAIKKLDGALSFLRRRWG